MVNLIKDPFVEGKEACGDGCSHGPVDSAEPQRSYDGYVEPDTKIPPRAKSVLAEISVNGVAIDETSVLAEAQQHPAKNPGEALTAAARALVIRELLVQKARRLDIIPDPQFDPEGSVETDEDALIRQLMEQEIDTPVSDETIRQRYYELHKHRFKSETIFEARHILLAVRDEAELESRRRLADSLIEDLKSKPGSFSKLAKEYSDCPSGKEGGNLGQLTIGSTVREFEAVLEKMEPGQIHFEPVQSRFGLHIINLVNKIPGEVLPFEYVEERIGAWLEASSWAKAVSQYISILAGEAEIAGIDLDGAVSPLVQ